MALVAPKIETRNPLPPGQFFVTLNPDRYVDFRDWLAIYESRGLARLVMDVPKPSLFGGTDHDVTFEVLKPDVAFWWIHVFGPVANLTEATRVPDPVSDRINQGIEKASSAARGAADVATSIAPLVTVGLLLFLYFEITKGRRHGLF
jgi:hypothetical protein